MIDEEKDQFATIICMVAETYSKSLTEGQLKIYWKFLKIYSLQQIQVIAYQIISTSEFFPVPAKFLKLLNENEDSSAFEAWANFLEDLGRGIDSDDPVTKKVARQLGGREYLSRMNSDDLKSYKQSIFIKRYKDCALDIRCEKLLEFNHNSDIANIARSATKTIK